MVHKRSIRARILRTLRYAWREKGKGQRSQIRDMATGEVNLKYSVEELDLPRGTTIRLGAYGLDVEDVIERKYREMCREMGVDRFDRVEALAASVSWLSNSLITPFM